MKMIVVNKNIEIKKMGNQYMIKDETKEVVHILDDIAGEIIIYLQKGCEINEIVKKLAQKYVDTEETTIYNDVNEFIETLKHLEIIT